MPKVLQQRGLAFMAAVLPVRMGGEARRARPPDCGVERVARARMPLG